MCEAIRQGVEVISPLPGMLNPYHPDSLGKIPALISNGAIGKTPFARAAHIPIIINTKVTEATSIAEDAFHKEQAEEIFGPSYIGNVPYPLALATKKLEAGIKVLTQDDNLESFFTHDTAYRLMVPDELGNLKLDTTIHKPKAISCPEDVAAERGRLAQLLYEVSHIRGAKLLAVSGIARYDEISKNIDLYYVETELGDLKQFDMPVLINKLTHQTDFSMGMRSFEAAQTMVTHGDTLPVHVMWYAGQSTDNEGNINLDNISIADETTIRMSAENNLRVQMAALGYIDQEETVAQSEMTKFSNKHWNIRDVLHDEYHIEDLHPRDENAIYNAPNFKARKALKNEFGVVV